MKLEGRSKSSSCRADICSILKESAGFFCFCFFKNSSFLATPYAFLSGCLLLIPAYLFCPVACEVPLLRS